MKSVKIASDKDERLNIHSQYTYFLYIVYYSPIPLATNHPRNAWKEMKMNKDNILLLAYRQHSTFGNFLSYFTLFYANLNQLKFSDRYAHRIYCLPRLRN